MAWYLAAPAVGKLGARTRVTQELPWCATTSRTSCSFAAVLVLSRTSCVMACWLHFLQCGAGRAGGRLARRVLLPRRRWASLLGSGYAGQIRTTERNKRGAAPAVREINSSRSPYFVSGGPARFRRHRDCVPSVCVSAAQHPQFVTTRSVTDRGLTNGAVQKVARAKFFGADHFSGGGGVGARGVEDDTAYNV